MIRCGTSKLSYIAYWTFTLEIDCSLGDKAGPTPDFSFGYLTTDLGRTWNSWLASGNEHFIDGDVGWRLFTELETNLHRLQQTNDGGLTWKTIKTIAWEKAWFDFVSEQAGWAIVTSGEVSALVRTTDGGRTWTEIKPIAAPVASPSSLSGYSISLKMEDAKEGWAMVYDRNGWPTRYFHVTDSGRTWQDITPQDGLSYCGNFFLDGQTAWLSRCGEERKTFQLLRTKHSGKTWTVMNAAIPGESDLQFTSPEEGWLTHYGFGAGSGELHYDLTHDGGATWSPLQFVKQSDSTPMREGEGLFICNICGGAIYFDGFRFINATGTGAWGPGVPFTLDITTDYGENWKHLEIQGPYKNNPDYIYTPDTIVFFNQMDGLMRIIIKAPDNNYSSAFYTTRDGGFTWRLSSVESSSKRFFNYNYISLRQAIASSENTIFVTRDGMLTWSEIHPNIDFQTLSADGDFKMQFVALNTGWVYYYDSRDTPVIYSTTDGGWTWMEIKPVVAMP